MGRGWSSRVEPLRSITGVPPMVGAAFFFFSLIFQGFPPVEGVALKGCWFVDGVPFPREAFVHTPILGESPAGWDRGAPLLQDALGFFFFFSAPRNRVEVVPRSPRSFPLCDGRDSFSPHVRWLFLAFEGCAPPRQAALAKFFSLYGALSVGFLGEPCFLGPPPPPQGQTMAIRLPLNAILRGTGLFPLILPRRPDISSDNHRTSLFNRFRPRLDFCSFFLFP